MFIGPPKLVFIKTSEGGTQAALRTGGPKGQTILVAPAPITSMADTASATVSTTSSLNSTPTITVAPTTIADDSPDEAPPPRILRRHAAERKYGKRQKADTNTENDEAKDDDNASVTSSK